MAQPTIPLRLTQDGLGRVTLTLAGIDITRYVAADGLSIEYLGPDISTVGGGGYSIPTVTLKFGPGRLALDLDIELLENLLDAAKAER